MNLGVNRLFELSKQARKSRDYDLEKCYLMQALSVAPTNTKVITALIRNLRKEEENILELKKWLEILYGLKPDGKILTELIRIETKCGNFNRVLELFDEKKKIEPNNKRLEKRKRRIIKRENIIIPKKEIFALAEEDVELIKNSRDIIYSEEDYLSKYNKLLSLLTDQSEEVTISLLAELYKSISSASLAVNLVKKYKKGLDPELDKRKIKLANKLLELVLNKSSKKYHWDDFWRQNVVILKDENQSLKVLVKK